MLFGRREVAIERLSRVGRAVGGVGGVPDEDKVSNKPGGWGKG